jgi:putative redox protein
MVEMKIVYQGELRCQAIHGPSGTTLVSDAPLDNHGKGESFSPSDLVATALGSCMMTIMGIVAARQNLDLRGTTVTVQKEMVTQPVRRIGKLTVNIHVPVDVSDDDRKRLENAAFTCPVHKSIHPDIEVPVTFKWGK